MFDFSFDKLIVIAVIAVIVIGPAKLPGYAAQLGRLVRSIRTMADGAKTRLRDEMGPELDDFEWSRLDPRQYDPRRIIRDALTDELTAEPSPARVSMPRVSPPPRTEATRAARAEGGGSGVTR